MIQQTFFSSFFFSIFFYAGGAHEQFWHGQGCPLFDLVHSAFSLLTTASPTIQGALKDVSEEAVMVRDMLKQCKFPSLDSCKTRFLWTHKEVDLVKHPVVGLALLVGDTEKFPKALGFNAGFRLKSFSTPPVSGAAHGGWIENLPIHDQGTGSGGLELSIKACIYCAVGTYVTESMLMNKNSHDLHLKVS